MVWKKPSAARISYNKKRTYERSRIRRWARKWCNEGEKTTESKWKMTLHFYDCIAWEKETWRCSKQFTRVCYLQIEWVIGAKKRRTTILWDPLSMPLLLWSSQCLHFRVHSIIIIIITIVQKLHFTFYACNHTDDDKNKSNKHTQTTMTPKDKQTKNNRMNNELNLLAKLYQMQYYHTEFKR